MKRAWGAAGSLYLLFRPCGEVDLAFAFYCC